MLKVQTWCINFKAVTFAETGNVQYKWVEKISIE